MDMLVDSLVSPPSDSHSAPPSYHVKCGTSAPRLESSHGKQLQQQQEDDAAEWSRSSWDMPVNGTPLSCENAVTPAFFGTSPWPEMTRDDSYQSSIHDGYIGYMGYTQTPPTWHLWCGIWASSCCSVSCKSWQSLPCSPKAKACIRLKRKTMGVSLTSMKPGPENQCEQKCLGYRTQPKDAQEWNEPSKN